MLPVAGTGAQASSIPHVLPGSPDWCAPLKGLVLEGSSCACDRWYFYARKQNQDIWWTLLSLQTAWSYRCKARSFMPELQNCEWNLKAVLTAYFKKIFFFYFVYVFMCVCATLHEVYIYICITSLSSKLLWILLRWNNYCFGKLHKVLAAFTAGLIYVYTEEEKHVLFKWVQLIQLEIISYHLFHWKICLSRTSCTEGESPGSYQQMSGWSVCLCYRHIWCLLVYGEGLGKNLLLPLCGTALAGWKICWYQVLESWPINDDYRKLVWEYCPWWCRFTELILTDTLH